MRRPGRGRAAAAADAACVNRRQPLSLPCLALMRCVNAAVMCFCAKNGRARRVGRASRVWCALLCVLHTCQLVLLKELAGFSESGKRERRERERADAAAGPAPAALEPRAAAAAAAHRPPALALCSRQKPASMLWQRALKQSNASLVAISSTSPLSCCTKSIPSCLPHHTPD